MNTPALGARRGAITLAVVALAAVGVAAIGVAAARAPLAISRDLALSRGTGWASLAFLVASLAMTPLGRARAAWARGARPLRRTLGLTSAALAGLHLALVLATGLVPDVLLLVVEPQARAGAVAAVILAVLALTSSGRIVRALAIRPWRELHALAYGAALFAVVHVALSPWVSVRGLAAIAGLVGMLLATRLVPRRRAY